ncbi:MAG: hypothetical protein WDN76_09940 [Alphaproteobacteria bacterium]
MVEITIILLVVVAFAGGFGMAAAHNAHRAQAERLARQRPNPRSMPATQTADVRAKAGRDPAARL